MPAKRRIAFVTGSRAEYGLLRSSIHAAHARRQLQPLVIVTGMHLLKKFGYTIDDIRRDGIQVAARVAMQTGRSDELAQARALARGVDGIARALRRLRAEIVVVLGDRIEALAAALAASASDRVLAHIHGGDVAPGHLDDAFRHAITKLAHVHYAASKDAARRIVRLGEDPKHVFVVGAPGLDDLGSVRRPGKTWLAETFGVHPQRPTALVMMHPVGRDLHHERAAMIRLLSAVAANDLNGVIVYPNSDPGHQGIIQAIREKTRSRAERRWAVVKSLPRQQFLLCLKAAQVVVGNSSCGIIEAHSAGTAAVNVGRRQEGRLRHPGSVIDCSETGAGLARAIGKARNLRLQRHRNSVYGDGVAGKKIAAGLARLRLSDNLRRKKIHL